MSSLHRSVHVAPPTGCGRPRWWEWGPVAGVAHSGVERGRYTLAIAIITWILAVSPALAIDGNSAPGSLSLVNRSVTQDQGAWIIDYRLSHTGKSGVIVTPEEIAVLAEGWVSNSRVASHALPRWSSLVISRGPDLSAISEVVTAADEAHRCRERLLVFVWTEDQGPFKAASCVESGLKVEAGQASVASLADPVIIMPLSLAPGASVRVRLRFEHQHVLYGEYDPLLAVRAIKLTIGSESVGDVVPLDREQYLAQPRFSWPEPPEERRDTRHAISGPDSLHLEAHVPGHQYYSYHERPVRYSTTMRLRFWYLIAAGTEGDCKVRVAQCQGHADILPHAQSRRLSNNA